MRSLIIKILLAVFLISLIPFSTHYDRTLAQQKDPVTIVKKKNNSERQRKKKKNKKKNCRWKHKKKTWKHKHKPKPFPKKN